MALAQIAPGATGFSGDAVVSSGASWMYDLRWLTGTVGFTAAGLALGAAAWAYPKTGRAAWIIVRASAAVGVAMLFIWIDAATVMHRISGIAFPLVANRDGKPVPERRPHRQRTRVRRHSPVGTAGLEDFVPLL